ncbi:hypothetical protein HO133_010665 [Letharia lupina]|uniref:thioredoxin-dependent peroxiredoxin n=1 Tax=Letharia lupina TaxID=560253 RepID=A0A8H6FDI2_9LECA|nr:uncharacterized protein HO133_010665 [Letharia lupina]KAF6224091.1 hypothetical protein HO133_010665 [Letharia lupina]
MVELRKRKAPPDPAPSRPPMKKANSVKSITSSKKGDSSANGSAATGRKVAVGDTITIDGFGGEVETNDGEKVTLKKLVDESKSGVVLFTYPKASTPGCTTQACLFRDEFTPLTATGYSIYGLSTDSPKSNTTFKTKQNLPYVLLCDPTATLIGAIGMKKSPSGTTRGVFVVNKDGKVKAVSLGGPAATVDVVREIVGGEEVGDRVEKVAEGEKLEKEIEEGRTSAQEVGQPQTADGDEVQAEVAAEVADSAQNLDGGLVDVKAVVKAFFFASMATNAGAGAARQLQSARTATAVWKKYTVQSHGVWERIRRALAIDPERSTGIPLNPQYRNPPPGANPPEAYDDPVTVPAGDIAENAYYKRDIRRNYPRLSVVKQADVVGLLSVGSKANPKEDVLQIGDAGAKQMVQLKQEGEQKGLSAFFEKDKNVTAGIFGPDGLPPFPSGMSRASPVGGRKYVMNADREQGYPEE